MKPALVLAGGLGTRLRPVVGEIPKPMADIAGKPFLWWLMRQLAAQGVADVYLSVGYRHELVREGMGEQFGAMRLHYVIEDEPLGTGGAVRKALSVIPDAEVLVFNGDTFAALELQPFVADAEAKGADVTIAVAQVADASRYGTVEVGSDGRIQAFLEKGRQGPGWINAGVYFLRKAALLGNSALPERFSFEQDFLSQHLDTMRITAFRGVRDFIDIGVPDDYRAAQSKVPALLAGA